MSETVYTVLDLSGIVKNVNACTFHNMSDISATFNAELQGSKSSTNPPDLFVESRNLGNTYAVSATVHHDTPPNMVPTTARITKIEIQFQTDISIHGDTHIISASPPATANSSAIWQYLPYNSASLPAYRNWITTPSISGVSIFNNPISGDSTAQIVSNPVLLDVLDFTTNPNGDFPLRYMDYATFVANFSTLVYSINVEGQSTVAGGNANLSCSADFKLINFQMTVTWSNPSSWTISPTNLTLPNNIITITRPETDVPPGDDDDMLSAIYVNGHKIEPNDPWVIIWLRFIIRIHFPVFDDDQPPAVPIEGDPIGTTFTGTVLLGILTITYADLSGIYTFDINHHHDTLYNRTATPTTQDVLIPAPFFVTAFFDTPEGDIQHFTGTRAQVNGAGTLKQIAQSHDYINTLQMQDIALRTANNKNPFSLTSFVDQQTAVRVYMDTFDDFFSISKLIIFIKSLFTSHPQ